MRADIHCQIQEWPLRLATLPILEKGWIKGTKSLSAQIGWKRAMVRAAARTMISENGVGGVHIRSLADRCGIAPQTIYNNFGGRDELILSAIDELLSLQLKTAKMQASNWGIHPILSVCELAARLLEAETYTRALVHSMVEGTENDPLRKLICERSAAVDAEVLKGMRTRDELQPWVDISEAVNMMDGVRFVTLKRWISEGTIEPGSLRHQMIASAGMCLIGISKGAAREAIEQQIEYATAR